VLKISVLAPKHNNKRLPPANDWLVDCYGITTAMNDARKLYDNTFFFPSLLFKYHICSGVIGRAMGCAWYYLLKGKDHELTHSSNVLLI